METGIPGEKDKDFTTVGKPKVDDARLYFCGYYFRLLFALVELRSTFLIEPELSLTNKITKT